jgi:prephenate dehydratase
MTPNQRFLDISLPVSAQGSVATLGPAGTSSEQAGRHLIEQLHGEGSELAPKLFHSYEDASAAVIRGAADLLLVANAYANVCEFYMSAALKLAGAFYFQTPQYGIAAPPDSDLSGPIRIASHPAPVPLIEQLLPEHLDAKEIVLMSSTSAAALATRSGQVDAALTTRPSAERYGLSFISRTRPIEMLWSVFRLAPAVDASTAPVADAVAA